MGERAWGHLCLKHTLQVHCFWGCSLSHSLVFGYLGACRPTTCSAGLHVFALHNWCAMCEASRLFLVAFDHLFSSPRAYFFKSEFLAFSSSVLANVLTSTRFEA